MTLEQLHYSGRTGRRSISNHRIQSNYGAFKLSQDAALHLFLSERKRTKLSPLEDEEIGFSIHLKFKSNCT